MADPPPTTFSLSQYEETKLRMRQLQQEQQAQKKRDAAAAATASLATTPQASDPVTAAGTAKSRTERAFSSSSTNAKITSSAAVSSRVATSNTATPVPRPSPTLARASSARAQAHSVAASSTVAAAATRVNAPPASSYSPLSPRTSGGWAGDRTDNTTRQLALGANTSLASPRRSTLPAGDALLSTAPFPVAISASPSSSTSSTPRHSQQTATASATFDPFQPISLPAPVMPSVSVGGGEERVAFQAKLEALSSALVSTAQGLGLKYSLDARLKQLIHELDSAHAASLRSSNDAVAHIKAEWTAAAASLQDSQSRYELELHRAKVSLSERQRKMDRVHAASVARATKEAETLLRGEYAEKCRRFEGIEKYNEAKMRSMEDGIRAQVKASLAVDARKSKSAEVALQAQLEKLEQTGLQLVQAKETELEELKAKFTATESRTREAQTREKAWERKWERLSNERKQAADQTSSLRVEIATLRTESAGLLHRLDRARDDAQQAERDAAHQASQLANRVMEAVSERDSLAASNAFTTSTLAQVREECAATIATAKHKHAHELDTIQSRISVVLQKKDDQIAQLKHQLQAQIDARREIERELGAI